MTWAHSSKPSCPRPQARGKGYMCSSVKHNCCILCSTVDNPLCACCSLQEVYRPEVTTPHCTRCVLCHWKTEPWCHPAWRCLRKESLCADSHKTFFLFRNAAIIFVNTVGKLNIGVRCLPAGMQPGMQHPGSQPFCISSITFSETWAGHWESH